MSQIRLYVDEDAAERRLVRSLRSRGMDVLTVIDTQMESATDEEQLDFAISQNRCLYSLNVGDFCRIHAEFLNAGKEHAGIVVIPRQRYRLGEKIRRLAELLGTVTAEEMRNRLEFL
jgi:DNA-binding transcriptional MerR regulator